jgi:uncharacterized protein (UPF0179 family)
MRKLMLKLEALEVETFEVVEMHESSRGTVKGAESESEGVSCPEINCPQASFPACPTGSLSCDCVTGFCASRVRACLNTE